MRHAHYTSPSPLPALRPADEAGSHYPVVWARIARAAGVLLLNVRAC